MIELYINGQKADIEQKPFTYTLQVNDMFNFDTREVSYSETIYLPTTPTNNIIFGFANEPISDKSEAYKTHKVDYYVNGIPIVQNAIGYLIGERNNYYTFEFKDRALQLYQFLRNRDIKGLVGLLDDNAKRTISNIKDQHDYYNNESDLLYLIGNYGDDAAITDSKGENLIEYDFDNTPLSIRLDRIFRIVQSMSGITFEGDIFKTGEWNNTFIASSNIKYNDNIEGDSFNATYEGGGIDEGMSYQNGGKWGFKEENKTFKLRWLRLSAPYIVKERGEYKITITINNLNTTGNIEAEIGMLFSLLGTERKDTKKVVVKEDSSIPQYNREFIVPLSKGEAVLFFYYSKNIGEYPTPSILYNDGITLKIEKVKRNDDIDILLTDFALTDLFKEVFRIFSITPIRDRKTGDYYFYTLNERVNAPELQWSDKFVRVKEGMYHNLSYGQKNNFVYKKYDDENAYKQEHNDSFLFFNDNYLPERKDFQSKFYSPFNDYTLLKGQNVGIENMEFFVKELKKDKDGNITAEYKEKTARWHILNYYSSNASVLLKLKSKIESEYSEGYKFASFSFFKWQNLLNTYYKDLPRLLEHPYIVTAEFALNEIDIYEFSFFSRIYVEQLGAYFLPNKIKYKAGAVAEVEMIKIN